MPHIGSAPKEEVGQATTSALTADVTLLPSACINQMHNVQVEHPFPQKVLDMGCGCLCWPCQLTPC